MRQLTPYEKTQLARYKKGDINLEDIGESPIEYITGKVEFMDQVFDVNRDVLIPRIETEELVNMAVSIVEELANLPKIVIFDIGTGSGAIGISVFLIVLKSNPNLAAKLEIILSDLTPEIMTVTKKNIENLVPKQYQSQLTPIQSDLLANYPAKKANLVLANLPYIPEQRISHLDESVKDYEPHIALNGGESGLVLIQKMLTQLPKFIEQLAPVILEVDHTHLVEELQLDPKHWQTENIFDQFQRQRFFKLIYLG